MENKKLYAVISFEFGDFNGDYKIHGIFDNKNDAVKRMESKVAPLLAKDSYIYEKNWHIRTCEPDYFLAQCTLDGYQDDVVVAEIRFAVEEYTLNQ